ncbi:MAG: hypothetical protein ABWY51_10635 [Gaiellaceae bacterium]
MRVEWARVRHPLRVTATLSLLAYASAVLALFKRRRYDTPA